jgi:small subunit ribosomal protein S20
MPITRSAKKALRKSLKRQKENKIRKEVIKRAKKEFLRALGEKNIEKAKECLSLYYKAVDKAMKSKVIKKNTASRLKSKMAKKLKSLLVKEGLSEES